MPVTSTDPTLWQRDAVRKSRPGKARSRQRLRRRGAAAVELAIAAPLLFLLIFGMVEFGRLMMVRQALNSAARAGCREAVLTTTTSSQDADAVVRAYLESVVPDASNVSKLAVSMSPSVLTGSPSDLTGISSGTPITVVVGVNFSDVSWLPGSSLGLGDTLVLTGRSTQRRE